MKKLVVLLLTLLALNARSAGPTIFINERTESPGYQVWCFEQLTGVWIFECSHDMKSWFQVGNETVWDNGWRMTETGPMNGRWFVRLHKVGN